MQGRRSTFCPESLTCIRNLASAIGPDFTPEAAVLPLLLTSLLLIAQEIAWSHVPNWPVR